MANEEIRKSILILLRPLVQINFIFGTCPCLISPQGQIKTPYKLFNFARFFLIVGLLIFYSGSSLLQVCISLYKNPTTNRENQNPQHLQNVSFTAISSKGHEEAIEGLTLTNFVDMFCGFYSNLVPAVFLCMACCKRKEIVGFFDTMTQYVNGVTGFGNYAHIKMVTTRLFIMHGFFTLIITTMISLRLVSTPAYGPGILVALIFQRNNGVQPEWVTWAIVPFSAYMSIAKTVVTAFIEVCCVSLSACFCKVIENIQHYLDEVMRNWSRRFLGKI